MEELLQSRSNEAALVLVYLRVNQVGRAHKHNHRLSSERTAGSEVTPSGSVRCQQTNKPQRAGVETTAGLVSKTQHQNTFLYPFCLITQLEALTGLHPTTAATQRNKLLMGGWRIPPEQNRCS